jgi:Lrp/AsnC family leucine-responsive transcriptional regulator
MKNKTQIGESAISQNAANHFNNNTVSLDAKDLMILRLLQDNARMSVKEISEAIQLSTTPVHERIKRLEASGVIKQYATLLDGAKLRLSLIHI